MQHISRSFVVSLLCSLEVWIVNGFGSSFVDTGGRGPISAASSSVELSTLQDLQIGSFEGGADAVVGGVVQSAFAPTSPALIGPNEAQSRFWALLSNVADSDVPLGGLTVTSSDPSVAVAHVKWPAATSHQSISIGNVLKPLVVDVVYECRRGGAAGLTLTYSFSDARLAPVELSLTKECAQRPRVGLCLGTSAEIPDDIARNGVARWTIDSALKRILGPSDREVDLFWTLRSTGGADDTASQLMSPPRVTVTPLSLKLAPEGPIPVTEVRRWQRRLAGRSAQEANERRNGLWGLDASAAQRARQSKLPAVARVQFIGALQEGGALPQSASLPAGSPPPGLKLDVMCVRKGAALVEVEIAPFPAYQPYRPVTFAFVKQCGGAVRQGFDVATHMLVPNFVQPNLLRNGAPVKAAKKGFAGDVGNLKSTASVYWRSSDPSRGPPDAMRVTCEGGIVQSSVLAPSPPTRASGGILAGRQDIRFSCTRSGISWCTVHFAWKLYEGPSVRLRKFCGGERDDVDVFSDMAGAPAVFLQGSRQDRAWGKSPEVTLPADQDKTTFTVSLDRALKPGEQILKVAPPQIRVYSPEVVEAVVLGQLAKGGDVDADKDGGSDLEVETKCKKTGTSRIEVTLPISSFEPFKPLNFAFSKTCVVVGYWQQWYVVALLTFAMFFSVSCLAVLGCVYNFQTKLSKEITDHHEMEGMGEA